MMFLSTINRPEYAARRFEKFICHELNVPSSLVNQEMLKLHSNEYLFIYNAVWHDRQLRIEADIMVSFNSNSFADLIKSVTDPDSMCFGTLKVFHLVDRAWSLLSEYHINEKQLSDVTDKINDHARIIKYQDNKSYDGYALAIN